MSVVTFRILRGFLIGFAIIFLSIFGFIFWMLTNVLKNTNIVTSSIIIGILTLLFIVAMIYGFRLKYEITDLGITICGFHKTTEITWSDITEITVQKFSGSINSPFRYRKIQIIANNQIKILFLSYIKDSNELVELLKEIIPKDKWFFEDI